VESPLVHYRSTFLPPTETFIHAYLQAFRRVRPLVVCLRQQTDSGLSYDNLHTPLMAQHPPGRLPGNLLSRRLWRLAPEKMRRDRRVHHLLSDCFERLRPSLVHAHFGTNAVHVLEAKARLGFPLVTTFYGGWDTSRRSVLDEYRSRYRKLWRLGDCFLVEGPFMKGQLMRLGCPPGKIRIQRMALDLRLFPFVEPAIPRPGERTVILTTGRFVEMKGLDVALEAFATVARKRPELELRIIGDGELRGKIEAAREASGAADRIHLLGMLPFAAYREELRRCHLVLCGSRTGADGDSEGGAPTVLLEAQAMGRPIVATAHCDIPHVVPPETAGQLAPEGQVQPLAEALLRMLETPDSWSDLARAGRAFIETHHDVRIEAAKLEDLYAGLGVPLATPRE
jgi:colanic acid/amylovoran biosynthesis glycosyltransferase